VPRIENSAWFWLIGSSCPLQNAQPFGGKFASEQCGGGGERGHAPEERPAVECGAWQGRAHVCEGKMP
jgi:hypothetical protein